MIIKYSFLLFALMLISDVEVTNTQNPCISKETCGACIQTPSCAWCKDSNYGSKPRCFKPELFTRCPEEFIVNPDNEEIVLKNLQLTKPIDSKPNINEESNNIVQISPQHINLKLRMNNKHTIKINYVQPAENVDLYYLMDLSKSMEDDKQKLSYLGEMLVNEMKNVTSHLRIGFGSFVDKVLMPYTSTVPRKLKQPCDGCEAPYGYHNVMSLSSDTHRFSEYVKNAHISGNLDAPEGGFDAIMQAIVCNDVIGWRENARRILVFSTDAESHLAGDGKLGGVLTPNDGKCHMENNVYTYSSIQDYPSISQINVKAKESHINIIFAVTKSQQKIYKKMSKNIQGSSSAILSEDSSNVVELVLDEYNKITSSVEMKDSASSSVEVSYWSKCLGDTKIQTNKCQGLKVGDVVEFEADIIVTSCPTDSKDRKKTFKIYPVGVGESLTVDLEMICSCD